MPVAASVERTWAGITDWRRQGEWMLGTTVTPLHQDGQGVGGTLRAFTGLGRVGVPDPMEITGWNPPYACQVRHLGKVVRGVGVFAVEPRQGGSTFCWREELELPLGVLGRLGWPLVRPLFTLGVRVSLRRFSRWVVSGR